MGKLKSKVALITGGTSGIGFATAKEFIAEGATVIITGRNQETIDEAVKLLGTNAFGFACDAGKMSDIFELQKNVKRFADNLDILFVNAGYGKFASIENVDGAFFDELFNVHVKGGFFTAQQALAMMNSGGSIIFNASMVADFGFDNFTIYSAAKAAIQSFVKTFSTECTPKNIRVNGINPGYIRTKGFEKTGLSPEEAENVIDSIIPTLPFKRFGTPEEAAKTVVFLASDDASYIQGTLITIDGGLSNIK